MAQRFIDFVARHCPADDVVPVLIAHNGRSFDVPWLAAEFARSGLEVPAKWHYLDTFLLAKRALSGQQASSLSQVPCSCPPCATCPKYTAFWCSGASSAPRLCSNVLST